MKYKFPSGVMAFALLFLVSFSVKIFPSACMNLMNGSRLVAMLHSIDPAHTIIKDTANTVIDKDGSYGLYENITSATVLVSANRVIIDLNGHTLSASDSSSDPLITIDQNVEDVIIKNGAIVGNCLDTGIQLSYGTKRILLQDLRISDCLIGIDFAGQLNGGAITSCRIENCHIKTCSIAVDLDYAQACIFKDVIACCCEYTGFDLYRCRYNKFEQCKVIGVNNSDAAGNAYGFISLGGLDNLFYECFAENIYKDGLDSDWCTKAIGFYFTGEERESKIINCLVDSVSSVSWANAIGIKLDTEILDSLLHTTSGLFDEDIKDMDLSPDCRHIALACSDNTVRVLNFDGESLAQVAVSTFDRSVNAVAWSPDGQYLAIGTDTGHEITIASAARGRYYHGLYDPIEFYNIEFVSSMNKELYVYRFDCGLLQLVTDSYVGEEDVTWYDPLATIAFTYNNGTAPIYQSSYYDGTGIPTGNSTPADIPRPPSGTEAATFYWNMPTINEIGKAGGDVLKIVWSRDGNEIFVTTKGEPGWEITGNPWDDFSAYPDFYYYDWRPLDVTVASQSAKLLGFSFDGENLELKKSKVLDNDNASHALAVSPDDRYIAYGRSNNTNMLRVDEILPDSFGTMVADNVTSGTLIDSVDWNPIACCTEYLLAVAGFAGSGSNLEVLQYKADETTVRSLVTEEFDGQLTSVKWGPSGKELVVTGIGPANELGVFSFSVAGTTGTLENLFTYDTAITGTKFVDWGACGKYIIVAGNNTEDTLNVEVLEVGTGVECCLVDGNKVANAQGGLCAIGIMGASCCNCITRNVAYNNCVNFSEGVYNALYKGLAGKHSLLGNWAIPPY